MREAIWVYVRLVRGSVRSQMQYRASFLMLLVAQGLITVVDFAGIWVLFNRFSELGGWNLAEVGVLYGMVNAAFALAEAFGRGFDTFSNLVKSGGFDRLLIRPRSALLQVAASELQLMRFGRFFQGIAILAWALGALEQPITCASVALLALSIFAGACLFIGLFVLQATWSFWTIDSLELMNTVTYGGTEAAQFPLSIYAGWFRHLFTFVVPLATISYFPALALLGRPDTALGTPRWWHGVAPMVGIAFLLATLLLWQVGVRHYRSTGS